MVRDVAENLPAPALVIVGEPTGMRIVNGHKGCYLFETRLKGQAAHSSQPHRGGNAILAAGRLIAFLAEMAAQKRLEAPGGCPFDPPYPTFPLAQTEGGTAITILAQDCSLPCELRPPSSQES